MVDLHSVNVVTFMARGRTPKSCRGSRSVLRPNRVIARPPRSWEHRMRLPLAGSPDPCCRPRRHTKRSAEPLQPAWTCDPSTSPGATSNLQSVGCTAVGIMLHVRPPTTPQRWPPLKRPRAIRWLLLRGTCGGLNMQITSRSTAPSQSIGECFP